MAMSWLADRNATNAAAAMALNGDATGSVNASSPEASTSRGWIVASQPRRRPKWRIGPGGGT